MAKGGQTGQTAVNLVFLLVYSNLIFSIVIGVTLLIVIMARRQKPRKTTTTPKRKTATKITKASTTSLDKSQIGAALFQIQGK